jgi:hypothetical protein
LEHFDPESIDLAELTGELRDACGHTIEDVVIGKTLLRDEVVDRFHCSLLEAEQLVDTLIARAFVRQTKQSDGREWLVIGAP